MKLYPWQTACLKAWEANHFRGIAHVTTGAGKTVLALNAMDRFLSLHPEGRVRIIVPTIPLAQQWETALLRHENAADKMIGFFGGGSRDDADTQILIYIVNSARDALSTHVRRSFSLGQHVLLICDECHHYQSPQNRRIFDFTASSYAAGAQYACLGLSATPFGGPGDTILTQSLGPVIFQYDFQTAAAEGIVSSFSVCDTSVSFLPEERIRYLRLSQEIFLLLKKIFRLHPDWERLSPHAFMKAVLKSAQNAKMDPSDPCAAYLLKTYERKGVTSSARSRLQCCLALIESLPETARILVFCERIEQAESMARLLRRRHASICAVYHSKMSSEARQRNMSDFREGRVRVLVSCRCLDEGVDVPDTSVGIVLSGAAVPRQRIQRLGRILRRAEGKEAACLYYLYIRESTEDSSYLPGIEASKCRALRYLPEENAFSSELYEFAAREILASARRADLSSAQQRELRHCLAEGLPRADYLLSSAQIQKHRQNAASQHEANYWMAMEKIRRLFDKDQECAD
ncbi:MAG: DEAD/DEAH box helicase [Clostridia bacterium]|nr:DEAD/DEAH box helicase [Clostridia bacterium]